MHRRPRPIVVALVIVTLMSGGCNSSSVPTFPDASATKPTAPGPLLTYTLSGVARGETAAGSAPIEGARVEIGDLRVYVGGLRLFALTDADGFYSIPDVPAGKTGVRAIKFGYELGAGEVTIGGDTQLDFHLVSRPTYMLSGVVSEMTPTGAVPVQDVDVYCDSCGEFGHSSVQTDAQGVYRFPRVYDGVTPLWVTKAGYAVVDPVSALPTGSGSKNATVNGHTRFDIELVRR